MFIFISDFSILIPKKKGNFILFRSIFDNIENSNFHFLFFDSDNLVNLNFYLIFLYLIL